MLSLTVLRSKVEILLSSYRRMLMVSKAHVLSANKPDFKDIMTLQASGVPKESRQKTVGTKCSLINNLTNVG